MADEPTEETTEAVGNKRKARVNPGQHKCWILGCDCRVNLQSVLPSRVPDARYCLEVYGGIDPTGGVADATPRLLPLKNNKLCTAHHPELPAQQIIGAEVFIPLASLVEGVVQGPKPSTRRAAAGSALSAAALIREQRWLVKEKAGDVLHEMSTGGRQRCSRRTPLWSRSRGTGPRHGASRACRQCSRASAPGQARRSRCNRSRPPRRHRQGAHRAAYPARNARALSGSRASSGRRRLSGSGCVHRTAQDDLAHLSHTLTSAHPLAVPLCIGAREMAPRRVHHHRRPS